MNDVDVAVYLDDAGDGTEQIANLLAKVTAHFWTDEVDLIVRNTAPTTLQVCGVGMGLTIC